MPNSLLRVLASAAAILLVSASAIADDAYAIKLWRPAKAGDKYTLTAKIDEDLKTKVQTRGVAKTEEKNNQYLLNALMEVKTVDKKGVETAARLTIKTLSCATDADPVDLVPAGTQVEVTYIENRYSYQSTAAALSPQALQALGRTFPRTNEKTVDDESFGTPDKKKVGDTWLVNPKALLKNITLDQARINAEKVAAVAKLVSLQNFYGADWLSVQITLQATEITSTDALKVREGFVNIEFNGLYPKDPAIQKQTAASKIQIHILADIDPTPANPAKRSVTIDAETRTEHTQILTK